MSIYANIYKEEGRLVHYLLQLSCGALLGSAKDREKILYEEGSNMVNFEGKKRLTITEVAQIIGVSAKTIVRWEKLGRISKAKRDWRGWRVYNEDDLSHIKEFNETVFEV